jgi:hypothetical protein
MRLNFIPIYLTIFVLASCTNNTDTTSTDTPLKAKSTTVCTNTNGAPIAAASEFFPLIPNSRWIYTGINNSSVLQYINEVNILGSQTVGNTQTTTLTESNYTGTGSEKSYLTVDANSGVQEWSTVLDGSTELPLDVAVFPLSLGKQCTQTYTDIDFGSLDPYTTNSPHLVGSSTITVNIASQETVITKAGTFNNAIRFEISIKTKASVTVDGKVVNVEDNTSITEWNARNIGRIKTVYNATSLNPPSTQTATEELTDFYIPVAKASNCITGDAVIAANGYGAEYFPQDFYSAWMMDSYSTTTSTYSSGQVYSDSQAYTSLSHYKDQVLLQGVNTTHLYEIKSSIPPVIFDSYTSVDSLGLYDWSYLEASNILINAPTPITKLSFPLTTGNKCSQISSELSIKDIDFDNLTDSRYIVFNSDIVSFGSLTTPLGTFANTFEIHSTQEEKTRMSFGGIQTIKLDITEWVAPQVGLIKRTSKVDQNINTSTGSPTSIVTEDLRSNSFMKLPFAANDLVYDVYSNKIYASIHTNSKDYANHIIAIDPATGLVTNSVLVGINPNVLALSNDGSKLYIGMLGEAKVRSINIPSMTLNPSFTLGGDPVSATSFYAEDLAVVPNDPYAIAVAKFDIPNRNYLGISIYKNGVELANKTNIAGDGNIITFGSPNQLYGLPIHTTPQGLSVYNIDPFGITLSSSNWNQGIGIDMLYNNGVVYGSSGFIFNPLTQLKSQQFTFSPTTLSGRSIAYSAANNQIKFLVAEQGSTRHGQKYFIQNFDVTTSAQVSTSPAFLFQYYDGINSFDLTAASLVNLGANGLAFRVFGGYNSLPISEWSIILKK